MTDADTAPERPRRLFIPTLTKQCTLFMIGSALFALGSAPGLGDVLGAAGSNLMYFVGAWFFTAAGFIQLFLSGAIAVPVSYAPGRMVRAEWLAAAVQSFGTIMFNISTAAALRAKSVSAQEHFVWNPDAGGSVAFLISGVLVFVAYTHSAPLWDPSKAAWWSALVNFIGCVAFGVSAVGAYILTSGDVVSTTVATWGTFIGALGFFAASAVVLPLWSRQAR